MPGTRIYQPWKVQRRHGRNTIHIQEARAATFHDAIVIARSWAHRHTDTYWIEIQYFVKEIPEWVTVRMYDPHEEIK